MKGQEVFSAVIICRFLYSLFPLCLAHIRCANSTPPAIPGVEESRPRSQGKAVGAHRGEPHRQTADQNAPLRAQAKSSALLFWGRGEFFFNTMILDYPDVSDLACNCEFFLVQRRSADAVKRSQKVSNMFFHSPLTLSAEKGGRVAREVNAGHNTNMTL